MDAHSFKVSVIIPVYNAERFLADAVESALAQPETGEIILVEDKSPDNSLAVCRALEDRHEKIRLLQHPDKGNHGAGASRNLGLTNARYAFICFLDADDYMLPNRFKPALKVFAETPDADGVYDAVGTHFMDEASKEKWLRKRNETVTTIHKRIPPEEVIYCQALGRYGVFHTNGIVLKKDVFERTGLFDTELKLSQDTFMFIKIAALCRLYPGDIENPVANRRVHGDNRMLRAKDASQYKVILWNKLFKWSVVERMPTAYKSVILKYFILVNKQNGANLFRIIFRNPELLFNKLFYSYLLSKIRGIFAAGPSAVQ